MENSRSIGNRGEETACEMLVEKGYKILKRNFRTKESEIDIIAQYDEYIVFVEVKLRTSKSMGMPSEAVDFRKQQKIISAANSYISENNITDGCFRFDVVEILSVKGNNSINHIENAFWLE